MIDITDNWLSPENKVNTKEILAKNRAEWLAKQGKPASYEAKRDLDAQHAAFKAAQFESTPPLEDHDEKSEATAFASHRHHARIPYGATQKPDAPIDYNLAAQVLLKDDLTRIKTIVRAGIAAGVDPQSIGRRVTGSAGLDGMDGVTETTRQKIARLGLAAIKRRRKKR
jgi:hypothetical protein